MKPLYRAAQACVSFARMLSAAFYFTVAILLVSFALWLALPFGKSWILTAIAIIVGLQGAATGVKALEIFLTTRPAERAGQSQQRSPSSPGGRDRTAPRDRR